MTYHLLSHTSCFIAVILHLQREMHFVAGVELFDLSSSTCMMEGADLFIF